MSQPNKNNNDISKNKIPTFNSKLFLDIELFEDNISLNSDKEESELSIKSRYIELKDYLSNDLIEELEMPSYIKCNNTNENKISLVNYEEKKECINNIKCDNKTNNIKNNFNFEINNNNKRSNYKNSNKFNSSTINPLIPLLNKGYEFYPKNLRSNNFEEWQKIDNDEKLKIDNFIKNNEYLFNKNKKEDWYCSFCNNLNYSFRIKCNRCGSLKESSEYILKKMIEQQVNNIYNQNNYNYTNCYYYENNK